MGEKLLLEIRLLSQGHIEPSLPTFNSNNRFENTITFFEGFKGQSYCPLNAPLQAFFFGIKINVLISSEQLLIYYNMYTKLSIFLLNNCVILRVLIGQKPMVYCADTSLSWNSCFFFSLICMFFF